MPRLDHLAINVADVRRTREWYVSVLALTVEFEDELGRRAGLQDEGGFTLILATGAGATTDCALYFQVDDVDAEYRAMSARGVDFVHPPQTNFWGYGAGLTDPDGRFVGLWDATSMATHQSG